MHVQEITVLNFLIDEATRSSRGILFFPAGILVGFLHDWKRIGGKSRADNAAVDLTLITSTRFKLRPPLQASGAVISGKTYF